MPHAVTRSLCPEGVAAHIRAEVPRQASAAEAAAWLSNPIDSSRRTAGWQELIEHWANEPEWKDTNGQL